MESIVNENSVFAAIEFDIIFVIVIVSVLLDAIQE